MSQVFNDIHKEMSNYFKEVEANRGLAKKAVQEQVEDDKKVLEKSGVKEIFEEIRDSGLVKLREVDRSKKGFFRKLFYDDEKEYVPAEIVDNKFSISLRFDEHADGCSEVRIAVIRGELNIAHGYNRVDYTPIGKGNLADAIIEGLKNPLHVSTRNYIE